MSFGHKRHLSKNKHVVQKGNENHLLKTCFLESLEIQPLGNASQLIMRPDCMSMKRKQVNNLRNGYIKFDQKLNLCLPIVVCDSFRFSDVGQTINQKNYINVMKCLRQNVYRKRFVSKQFLDSHRHHS